MNGITPCHFGRTALVLAWLMAGSLSASAAPDWGEIPSKPAYAVDKARWMKMMESLVKDGERGTYGDSHGFITLSQVNPPDTSKSRQADYFTLLGIIANGNFHPQMTSFVSEKWELAVDPATGQTIWKIDQWIYSMALDGTPRSASHGQMTQTLDRRVLDSKHFPNSGVESPNAHKKWTELMALWLGQTGS